MGTIWAKLLLSLNALLALPSPVFIFYVPVTLLWQRTGTATAETARPSFCLGGAQSINYPNLEMLSGLDQIGDLELVDSLCSNGVEAQYMQCLSIALLYLPCCEKDFTDMRDDCLVCEGNCRKTSHPTHRTSTMNLTVRCRLHHTVQGVALLLWGASAMSPGMGQRSQ